jgi:hypothetical protein
MNETPDDLVARGYVSRTKAETAAQVCGKVFTVHGRRCAVFAADVRCDWFWIVFENGERSECHFYDLGMAEQPRTPRPVSYFRTQRDNSGEIALERYVFETGYSDALEALSTAEGRLVA